MGAVCNSKEVLSGAFVVQRDFLIFFVIIFLFFSWVLVFTLNIYRWRCTTSPFLINKCYYTLRGRNKTREP